MKDPDGYRAASRKSWGAVADGWEKHAPNARNVFMPVTAWMLDAADLQPGSRVLELAAGTGEVGLLAHELIQPGGSLLISDFAPEMLSAAQRHAESLGISDVRFKQIDAENIDIEAASLDVVLCRWGLMFLPDPEAALREIRRVLRPGGRVAIAAWAAAEHNPWSSVVGRVLVGAGHVQPPDPEVPGQFSFARDGMLAELLDAAGFVDDVEVEALDLVWPDTFDGWWKRTLEMSRTNEVVRALPADEQERVREALRKELSRYEDGEGVLQLPARALVAAATA